MRLLRPSTWFAALLVALVVVLPFQSQLRRDSGWFALEVRASADHSGHIQLYFDRGHGFNEADSSALPLPAGTQPAAYRLELPPGTFAHLRLDPTDRDGIVRLHALRIVDRQNRTVRELPLSLVHAGGQIQSLRSAGDVLEATVTPGGTDPTLDLVLDPPLTLRVPRRSLLAPYAAAAALVWAAILLGCAAVERLPGLRACLTHLWQRGRERPGRSIAVAAALAVILSSYPVIFFGKSFVSPNLGTPLLYDEFPTLPGYRDSVAVNAQGSDVGAIMWQQVPYSAVQHRSIFWNFEWPVWNRANAGGTPLLGQGQSMLGDPLHLLVVACGGTAWAWDAKYLLAKWLLAVGLGWSVWTLTRHRGAALLTALAAPFCGFFLYRLNHPAFFSFCYAPWILWAWLQLVLVPDVRWSAISESAGSGWSATSGRAPSRSGLPVEAPNVVRASAPGGRAPPRSNRAVAEALGCLLGANWMVLNSGTVKEAFALLFMMNGCGALTLLAAGGPWPQRLRRLAAAAGAGVLFAGLSSPFWFTFWDTLRSATTTSDGPLAWQIQPSLLLGFWDEAFYRPLTPGNRVFNPGANFLIGAGVLYFLATVRESARPRLLWGVLVTAVLSAALVFGAVPPSVIRQIPFLANIHHIDNSLSCVLILLAAVIAGVGFAAAERRLRAPAGPGDLAVAGALLLALIGAYVGFTDAAHRSFFGTIYPTLTLWGPDQSLPIDPFVWGYLASLVVALGAGVWLLRRTLQTGVLTPATALGLAICAGALLWRGGQLAGGAAWPDFSYRPGPRVDFGARSAAEKRVENVSRLTSPIRAVGLDANYFPGWTAYYPRAETISGPDAVSNRYYREVTDAAGLPRIWDWRIDLSPASLAAARPMLDLLNVSRYLDLRSDPAALGATLRLDQLTDLDVYESPSAWPRAFFTDRVETYRQPADFAGLLRRGDGRPFAAIQIGEPGIERMSALIADSSTRWGQRVPPQAATAYRLTENSTSFTVAAPQAGLAVLTETYWDGYPHAAVDGRPSAVVRINHAFIGVPVSAGTHRVEIRYRPRYFDVTLLIAALSALLLALFGFLACRAEPITD